MKFGSEMEKEREEKKELPWIWDCCEWRRDRERDWKKKKVEEEMLNEREKDQN